MRAEGEAAEFADKFAFLYASGARPPLQVVRNFIDRHRHAYGVESICKVLQVAPSGYWRHAAQRRNPALRSVRALRDEVLAPEIERLYASMMREPAGLARVTADWNRAVLRMISAAYRYCRIFKAAS